MKKGLFAVVVLLGSIFFLGGCIKNTPSVTTINPSMSATVGGNYNFVARYTSPATLDTQVVDTTTTLLITGQGSDNAHPYDKIVLAINAYKGASKVFSIVQVEAGAVYVHNGITSVAAGGVVTITSVSSTTITGYFSFNTVDNIAITGGQFTVGKP